MFGKLSNVTEPISIFDDGNNISITHSQFVLQYIAYNNNDRSTVFVGVNSNPPNLQLQKLFEVLIPNLTFSHNVPLIAYSNNIANKINTIAIIPIKTNKIILINRTKYSKQLAIIEKKEDSMVNHARELGVGCGKLARCCLTLVDIIVC